MQSGSFTGDGTMGREIIVGFKPEVLLVKADLGTSPAILKTTTMGTLAARLDANVLDSGLEAGLITSLTANGFRIESNAIVNGAGLTFYWVAFPASPALRVGTYQGTGATLSLTGLGFRPAWVWTVRQDKAGNVERLAGLLQGYGMYGNVYNSSISSFDADGFTIGTTGVSNTVGATHHYLAWGEVARSAKIGTFTGDASDNRLIGGMGFAPEVVFIQCASAPTQDFLFKPRSSGATVDRAFPMTNASGSANVIQQLTADGFELGSAKASNANGAVCGYAAFSR